ncbi:MAG: hypothetical protein H0W15_02970 [Gemmatimonadales bacterium]|nr:hypothetical protein [Gemmatimonadales bacterium]
MDHLAEQRRRVRVGAACVAAVAAAGWLIDGTRGAGNAAAMGAVATGMQLLAARVMWRTGVVPSVDHLKVYGMGVVLRALGVGVLATLLIAFPRLFLPAASVVGYLGTVLPLLYLETRLSR